VEFALQEMKVMLAILLQRYRLAVVPNARIEPKGSNLDTAHGMQMRIIPKTGGLSASRDAAAFIS
jgi:cytochrome P450